MFPHSYVGAIWRSDSSSPVDFTMSDAKLRTLMAIWRMKPTHGEAQSHGNHRSWMARFLNLFLKLTRFIVFCGSFSCNFQLLAVEGILIMVTLSE